MVIYWDFLGRVIEIFFLGIGTFVMLNWMDGSREKVFNFTNTICHLIAIFLLSQLHIFYVALKSEDVILESNSKI